MENAIKTKRAYRKSLRLEGMIVETRTPECQTICPVCEKPMGLYGWEDWARGGRTTIRYETYYCSECNKYEYVRMRMDWSSEEFPAPKTI